jgi:hypothetical protein
MIDLEHITTSSSNVLQHGQHARLAAHMKLPAAQAVKHTRPCPTPLGVGKHLTFIDNCTLHWQVDISHFNLTKDPLSAQTQNLRASA